MLIVTGSPIDFDAFIIISYGTIAYDDDTRIDYEIE